ncbi:MAG: hypothetical protein WCV62_03640 [Candidatus Peribacteraceae bacterium]|jgi:hypothetical protein
MKEAFQGTKYEHCTVRLVGAEHASRTEEADDLKDNALIRDALTLDESYGTEWFDTVVGHITDETRPSIQEILALNAKRLAARLDIIQSVQNKEQLKMEVREALDTAIYLIRHGVNAVIFDLQGEAQTVGDLHGQVEALHDRLVDELDTKFLGNMGQIYDGTEYATCKVSIRDAEGLFPPKIDRAWEYAAMVREARELGIIRSWHEQDPEQLRSIDAQRASWATAHLFQADIRHVTLKVGERTIVIDDLEGEYAYWVREFQRLFHNMCNHGQH